MRRRESWLLYIAAFAAGVVVWPSNALSDDGPSAKKRKKATLSREEIHAAAQAWHDRIKSVRVAYVQEADVKFELPEQAAPGQPRPTDSKVKFEYGFLGERRWNSQQLGEGDRETRYDWAYDGQRTYGCVNHLKHPGGLRYQIDDGRSKAFDRSDIFMNHGLTHPTPDESLDENNLWYYPHNIRPLTDDSTDLQRMNRDYKVLDELEVVGKVECHVLELRWDGLLRDKIWVDAERGCAIIKRVDYSPNLMTGESLRRTVWRYSGIEQIDGVWAPKKIVVRYFPISEEAKPLRKMPHTIVTMVVEELKINNVEPSDLEFKLIGGKMAFVSKEIKMIPGDKELTFAELAKLELLPFDPAKAGARKKE